MNILPAAQPADFEQAVGFAYRELEVGDMCPGVARRFDTADRRVEAGIGSWRAA